MNPALIVIDMQKRWLSGPKPIYPDLDEAVEIINHVAAAFREAGRPVIWVQDGESMDESDPLYAMPDDLDVQDGDLRVDKVASNAFTEAGLPEALAATDSDYALLCGFKAEACVLATARGAADGGLDYALLREAVVSDSEDGPAFVERINPLMSWEVAVALVGDAS
ncbi:MAG: cysteine hydrolase family protein [Planctomycetota bacterium]|jgi:nicotinamidase-related amidase